MSPNAPETPSRGVFFFTALLCDSDGSVLGLAQRYHAAAAILIDADFVFAGKPPKGQHDRVSRLANPLDQLGHRHWATLEENLPNHSGHFTDFLNT